MTSSIKKTRQFYWNVALRLHLYQWNHVISTLCTYECTIYVATIITIRLITNKKVRANSNQAQQYVGLKLLGLIYQYNLYLN